MLVKKCAMRPADRKRKVGWDQLRSRLMGEGGEPMIYFLESCEATIRTLPTIQHDEHDAEDVDTDSEDHAADETRYGVMSRPYIPRAVTVTTSGVDRLPAEMTFGQLRDNHLEKARSLREDMRI